MEEKNINKNSLLANMQFIENDKNDFNDRLNLCLKLVSLLKGIYSKDKNKYLFIYYRLNRDLGSLYFTQNYYELSELYFETSIKLFEDNKNFDLESPTNICITKEMLSQVKMMLFLMSGTKEKLNNAAELLKFIENNYDDNWSDRFKQNLIKRRNIYNNIIDGNLKTVVSMIIPYHIILSDKKIYFKYKDIKCSIFCETVKLSENGLIVGNNVYNEKDIYGLFNKTKITVEIGKYVNLKNWIKVNKEIESVCEPLTVAINVYNYFLKKYIRATKRYWLNDVNEKMIINYEMSAFAGDYEIQNIPFTASLSLSSSGDKNISLSDEDIECLKYELINNKDEDCLNYLFEAKKYYLVKDYRNAIILVNIALENFSFHFAKKYLIKYKDEQYIDNFLSGKVNYEDFYLKDYIKKEDFISAMQKKLITANPPSIYTIYKECNKHESLPINRTRLNKMINSIKSERNNIVHGKAIKKDLRFVAEEAIENFEKLLNILDKIN